MSQAQLSEIADMLGVDGRRVALGLNEVPLFIEADHSIKPAIADVAVVPFNSMAGRFCRAQDEFLDSMRMHFSDIIDDRARF